MDCQRLSPCELEGRKEEEERGKDGIMYAGFMYTGPMGR